VPLVGYNQAGLSRSQVGLGLTLVSVLNLAVLAPAGVLTDRAGRKAAIVIGVVATGLAMATFVFSTSLALFLASSAILGASRGLTGPAPNAYVVELAPAGRQGMALGLFRFFGDIGFVVGPVLLGWIADLAGYRSALGFDAVLMLALAVAFFVFAKETRVREAEMARVRV
jgi:MFS family permease